MKTVNLPFRKFFILLVLATTMGYAQQPSSKAKSDLNSAGAQTNPYFVSNELAGEMTVASGTNNEPTAITKQRTKSNNTNERSTNANNENPFSPKSNPSTVLKTKHDTAKNSVSNIR